MHASIRRLLALAATVSGCRQLERMDLDGDGYLPEAAGDYGAQGPFDCDETNPDVNPGAEDACDGLDNDCDGEVDAGMAQTTYYPDVDGDTYGDTSQGALYCEPPTGFVSTGGDCADLNSSAHPDATEACDGEDDDCDGEIDDNPGSLETWYVDFDGDGFGDDTSAFTSCDPPPTAVDQGGDCDDTDPAFNPDAPEDDCSDPNDYNCDDQVAFVDMDDDGHAACVDCDDEDPAIHPEADEICGNGVDDNCNDASDGCLLNGSYDVTVEGFDVQMFGENTSEQFGGALAGGVDLNDDGYTDLVVGSTYYSQYTTYPYAYGVGRITVFYGPFDGITGPADADVELLGTANYENLGSRVALAGDVDGNGKMDLLGGAPSYDPSGGYAYHGRVHLFTSITDGAAATATITCDSVSTDNEQCGEGLSPAGDVDADGYDDFLVAAPYYDAGASDSGRAGLFLGPVTGSLTLSNADALMSGNTSYERVGLAMAGADLDGDGSSDILVGASGDSTTTSMYGDGAVYIFKGGATGTLTLSSSVAEVMVVGSVSSAHLGAGVGVIGDHDQDGYQDYGVSSQYEDSGRGKIYLFEGAASLASTVSTSTAFATLTGEAEGTYGTFHPRSGGDVNGDGDLDVLVGAPNFETLYAGSVGATYLGYGPLSGSISLATLYTNDDGARWVGKTSYGYLGDAVLGLGDANGDGWDDLAFGEPSANKTSYGEYYGAAYIVYGASD